MTFPLPQPPRFDRQPPTDRMFEHGSFRAKVLMQHKGTTTITVAVPAKDEAETIGPIIRAIKSDLMDEVPLVDELLVIDDLSTDETAAIADKAGASVISSSEILPQYGSGGKGEALWKSLHASSGELITWCDADILNFDCRFVLGCLGPLLTNEDIGFIKGFYRRPLNEDGEGGGRVTELMARPLISNLFPHLDMLVQPLSGEFGGRRALLEQVPFCRGYAVDLGLLVDLSARFGVDTIAQVDLGSRVHRNRPLRQLGPQSAAILAMALRRGGLYRSQAAPIEALTPIEELTMRRPEFGDTTIRLGELPPLSEIS